MGKPWFPRVPLRAVAAAVVMLTIGGCQGMDRLEPDRIADLGDGGEGSERGTVLDAAGRPGYGGGRLTNEIARRLIREIEQADADDRLELAAAFLRDYPEADYLSYLHELVGDAHSELGQPDEAAAAWQRAIEMSYPAPDILALPLTNVQLPYEVGWAQYEAGNPEVGADWLVRASFISERPQLEQGLRFVFRAIDDAGDDFDGWFQQRRAALASRAPDFELPGYRTETLSLSESATRLTLINFWTPT